MCPVEDQLRKTREQDEPHHCYLPGNTADNDDNSGHRHHRHRHLSNRIQNKMTWFFTSAHFHPIRLEQGKDQNIGIWEYFERKW